MYHLDLKWHNTCIVKELAYINCKKTTLCRMFVWRLAQGEGRISHNAAYDPWNASYCNICNSVRYLCSILRCACDKSGYFSAFIWDYILFFLLIANNDSELTSRVRVDLSTIIDEIYQTHYLRKLSVYSKAYCIHRDFLEFSITCLRCAKRCQITGFVDVWPVCLQLSCDPCGEYTPKDPQNQNEKLHVIIQISTKKDHLA